MDYGKNNDEIILLTKKCLEVSDLYKLLEEKKEAEKVFRTYQYLFLHRACSSTKKNLREELQAFLQAREDLSGLQRVARHDLDEAQRSRPKKEAAYVDARDIYDEWRQKKNRLTAALEMIERLNIPPGNLSTCYEQYRAQKRTISVIKN